jgi:hypothetical protein
MNNKCDREEMKKKLQECYISKANFDGSKSDYVSKCMALACDVKSVKYPLGRKDALKEK